MDLCLTLAETSHQELARKISAYSGKVSFIEIRLDYLPSQLVPEVPGDSGTQFLATNRPRRQGGKYEGPEKDRLDLLRSAADRGFHWIDLENDVVLHMDWPSRISVVRSYHSFQGFPADLDVLLESLQGCGGDLFKIALQIESTDHLSTLLEWMEELPLGLPRVVIGMGALGQPTRILGNLLGNAWSYVSAADEDPAAPGQFSLEDARDLYGLESGDRVSGLYGVIGDPLYSLPQVRVHNRLFQHYGLEAMALPLLLDAVEPWFRFMASTRLPFKGLSVAEPFRSSVTTLLKGSSGKSSSEVDTLKREGLGWIGFRCTESAALLESLSEQFRIWTGLDADQELIREILLGKQ